MITTGDKLREIDREIGMRRHHYPKLIEQGKMSVNEARLRIVVMEAIAADYRITLESEPKPQLNLFDTTR
jgi:hypothetical protein